MLIFAGIKRVFMRKIALLLLSLTALCNTLSAQSLLETEISEFKDINIVGNITATLVRGEKPYISATLYDTMADKFEFFVKDNELHVRLKQPMSLSNGLKGRAEITITYRSLSRITSDGATILSPGIVEENVIVLTAIGEGNINLNVATRDVEIESTNSTITLGGDTEYLNIKAMAGSSINTLGLTSHNVNVTSNTASECYVDADVRLEAKAATRGKVYYKKDPEILKETTTTMGSISKIE